MSRSDPLEPLASLEGVPSGYSAARDGIDVLLRDRGMRRTSPEQTTESLLRGACASAELAGSRSSPDRIRAGEGDPTALAALRLSTELLSLAPVLDQSPLRAFARMHTVAATGQLHEDRLGRPVSAEAARRLGTLAQTLLSTRVAGLLQAAVVHAELATVAPFASHNEIIARAAERLVLVSRGVDPASSVVPEAGHLSLRAEYESNLRGYRDGGRAGMHAWLLYAPEAYARAVEASPLSD